MRLRVCVLACALATLGSFVAAGLTSAAPRHDDGLTIAAVPNPIMAGEGVLIYGQLTGPDNGNQPIRLYHHVDGSGRGFTLVTTTMTDSSGVYEFPRPEGLIYTNRDWFVRGPDGAHSRTIRERVGALVTVNASTQTVDTGHVVVFRGHVTPNHRFEPVFLQKQVGDEWRTVSTGLIGPGSSYLIVHRFRFPGVYDLRVALRGDAHNVRSASDSANLVVQQRQVPGFTIHTSAPVVDEGGSATISGVLDRPGTNEPEQGALVQLWARHPDQRFVVVADTTTGTDGSYSFGETGLTANTVYDVATMRLPHTRSRHTARLFEGVSDTVTMQANTGTAPTGQTVTFTGTVLPDKAGHIIYLQKLGNDGDFHTVEIGIVRSDSTFQFNWTMGSPDAYTFRVRIPTDEDNIGSASPPVSVTASAPAVSTLPSAS